MNNANRRPRKPAADTHVDFHYVSPSPLRLAIARARVTRDNGLDTICLYEPNERTAGVLHLRAPGGDALCKQLGLVPRPVPVVTFDDVRREFARAVERDARDRDGE